MKRAGGRAGWRAISALATVAAVSPLARLPAQTDARLVEALRLAQTGQADSARVLVRRVLAATPQGDSVYPQALLAAAKIAPDAPTVATNLNRIVVEYGATPWADDALLLLTQLYFAQRDLGQTIQSADRLFRDYPDSPLRARAGFAAARAHFELRNEARGCELIAVALAGAGGDVEFRNQVNFYAARCPGTPGATVPPPGPPATDTTRKLYAVQVLAVRSASQVDDMLTRLRVMGFDARVVRDTSGFFKVRVGRYATREEAQQTQRRLRTRVGGQPFVVEEGAP